MVHTSSTNQIWLLVMNPIGQWQTIGVFNPDGPSVSWYPHVAYEEAGCLHRPTDRATQEWAWNLLDVARHRGRLGHSLADLATHEVTKAPRSPNFVLQLGPLQEPAAAAAPTTEPETLALF